MMPLVKRKNNVMNDLKSGVDFTDKDWPTRKLTEKQAEKLFALAFKEQRIIKYSEIMYG